MISIKNKKIILGLLVAAIITASSVYYYAFFYGSKHKDPLKSESKVIINSKDLYNLFVKNEDSANQLYLDKVISVSGKVQNIEVNGGRYTLTLYAGDSSGAVICEMDVTENVKMDAVKIEDEITIAGFCNGYLMDVQLDRCKFED